MLAFYIIFLYGGYILNALLLQAITKLISFSVSSFGLFQVHLQTFHFCIHIYLLLAIKLHNDFIHSEICSLALADLTPFCSLPENFVCLLFSLNELCKEMYII